MHSLIFECNVESEAATPIAVRPEAFVFGPGNTILRCDCRASSRPPPCDLLSIRTMRRGREVHCLDRRLVAVDEDMYLIVDAGRSACSVYRGEGIVRPFAVFFHAGMLATAGESGLRFLPCLRPHGDAVSRRLAAIERQLNAGIADRCWLEAQLAMLLQDAVEGERELRRAASRIACVKPATRDELWRRVLLASDFIQTHYEQPITLDHIAGAARLSRFHLLRLFRQVHGITPHAYLLDKRLAAANRMLEHTHSHLSDIAERCGFGTRSSLFRHLQRRRGAGGRRLRVQGVPAGQPSSEPACRTFA